MPTCDIGHSKSVLCLKIATIVATIENAEKRIATMAVIREKSSKPGKDHRRTQCKDSLINNNDKVEKKKAA
jgi:hypothetical protein